MRWLKENQYMGDIFDTRRRMSTYLIAAWEVIYRKLFSPSLYKIRSWWFRFLKLPYECYRKCRHFSVTVVISQRLNLKKLGYRCLFQFDFNDFLFLTEVQANCWNEWTSISRLGIPLSQNVLTAATNTVQNALLGLLGFNFIASSPISETVPDSLTLVDHMKFSRFID